MLIDEDKTLKSCWKIERYQIPCTNIGQNPTNVYVGFHHVEPIAFIEWRHCDTTLYSDISTFLYPWHRSYLPIMKSKPFICPYENMYSTYNRLSVNESIVCIFPIFTIL